MIDIAAVGGTDLSDDADPAMPSPPPDAPAPSKESDGGSSAAEKTIGSGAAYKAPSTSSAAAAFMLRYETNPERREQTERNRHGAVMWFGVGIAVAIVGLIVIFSITSSR